MLLSYLLNFIFNYKTSTTTKYYLTNIFVFRLLKLTFSVNEGLDIITKEFPLVRTRIPPISVPCLVRQLVFVRNSPDI